MGKILLYLALLSLCYNAFATICIKGKYTNYYLAINADNCTQTTYKTDYYYTARVETYDKYTKTYNYTTLDNIRVGSYVRSITGFTRVIGFMYTELEKPAIMEYGTPYGSPSVIGLSNITSFTFDLIDYEFHQNNHHAVYNIGMRKATSKPIEWIPFYASLYDSMNVTYYPSICGNYNRCNLYSPGANGQTPYGKSTYAIWFDMYWNNYLNNECLAHNGKVQNYYTVDSCNAVKIITEDGYIVINDMIISAKF